MSIAGKASLQFFQLLILSRVLTPADFGVIAMVLMIIGFVQLFTDMGISNALIHYQNITLNERAGLFWLNLLVATLLMLLLMGLSSWVADFYHEPRLLSALMLACCLLPILALGQQLKIFAEKQLNFSLLAKIELAASSIGFIGTVVLVLFGANIYAPIAGLLLGSLVSTVLAWSFLSGGWRPELVLRLQELRKFLSYGFYMVGNNIVNSLASSLDVFLGGKMLGMFALGTYSLPRDLTLQIANVINPIVTRVGLPVMARSQDDKRLLKHVYLQTMRMTASVNFPVYLAIFIFSPELVSLLFGKQWEASIPLLHLLAIWGLFRSIGNPAGSLVFAVGRADLAFKWNAGWLIITPPILWFGLQFEALGLTWALLFLILLAFIPNWYVLIRPLCGASLGEYVSQLIPPLLAALLAAALSYACSRYFGSPHVRLLLGSLIGAASYLLTSYWVNRQWLDAMKQLILGANFLHSGKK